MDTSLYIKCRSIQYILYVHTYGRFVGTSSYIKCRNIQYIHTLLYVYITEMFINEFIGHCTCVHVILVSHCRTSYIYIHAYVVCVVCAWSALSVDHVVPMLLHKKCASIVSHVMLHLLQPQKSSTLTRCPRQLTCGESH